MWKCLVNKFSEEGMPAKKLTPSVEVPNRFFSIKTNGIILRNGWRKNLDVGDAQATLNYCKRKKKREEKKKSEILTCTNRFNAMRCSVSNLFWVDI